MGGEEGAGFAAGQDVGKSGEELGVFGGVADGDANRFGETHPSQGTNDDAFVEKFVAERFGVGADGDEEEIGIAGDGREMELGELEEKAAALGAIHFDGAANVLGVVKSGECGGLADAGDVEGRAELVHFGSERGMADAIADA